MKFEIDQKPDLKVVGSLSPAPSASQSSSSVATSSAPAKTVKIVFNNKPEYSVK